MGFGNKCFAAIMMAALGAFGGLLFPEQAAARLQTAPSQPGAFTVSLPLVVDNRRMPSLLVETTVTELLRVSPAGLADAIADLINDEAASALADLGRDLRPVEDLISLGYRVRLNPQTLAIEAELPLAARNGVETSLSQSWLDPDTELLEPGDVSFGVTGAFQLSDVLDDDADPAADLGLDGFANIGGLDGLSLDWGGRFSLRDGEADFQRNRLILFHDRPEQAVRYSAGDLSPQLARDTGVLNLLGVSVELNHRDLQPTRNIRPTGDRSLLLERRSTVEVYVNGTLIDRFTAGPGPVDLRDIPLANVSNQVSILVEDELGRREVDSFALSADISLLQPGLSEGVLAVGFRRQEINSGFEYDFEAPVLGGQVSRGLTGSTTASAAIAATEGLASLNGAIAQALLGGVAQIEITASDADLTGEGWAAGLSFRGGPYWGQERYGILNLRLDYSSLDFATLNDLASENDRRWSVGGDFRINATEQTALNLGFVYQDDHAGQGRSRTVSVGMNRRLGAIQVSAAARHTHFQNRDDEFGIFITLSRRIGSRQLISSSYDSASGGTRVEYRGLRSTGLPGLSGRATLFNQGSRTDLRGQANLDTTRFGLQLNADHSPPSAGLNERTGLSVRVQSGLAYSDGVFGIGRDPGRGFVIVDRHQSLEDAVIDVSLGASNRTEARADVIGPAVVSLTSAYRPQDIRIGARNLEPGYYIGPGRYTLMPGALTGARLTVGTEAFRTAVATIWYENEPLSLQYGQLENLDTGGIQSFFTNRAGRAAFNELTPGRYRASLPNGAHFRFEVENDAPAYINLGEIDADRDDD
ncbi:MAG: fimbria/pilus outer membrane usher protein [Alphaproteobacteria bacterium]|nr:fimbria/pilus outer membrane usher protein [Alphaproteobacteria bacterium]